ncbi:zincin-like metallopeptidase domain-containing protein [Paracoccus sp. S3-43]|uniref:ArdC family protein n=1 Tax=Paracoccus sp. S3-43 TaxID=3030011 RepID=UPI0023B02AD2|nr:zincin-like metallopeptidase domain-containing protein [Paracoccus sp. S3-43]WEF25842.1 zincin-like metallopeptidase domain-containing protein [Paracoccus sp. S3-43]
MPWHSQGGWPVNVASGRAYRGINVLMLWGEAQDKGFSSPLWGTFKQWQAAGAKVRKGEKASLIVFWKDLPAKDRAEGDEEEAGKRFVLKTSYAFNLAQTEGYEAPGAVDAPPHEPSAAERLVAAAGVDVRFGGDRAFYHPRLDYVQRPPLADFVSVPAFQSVLLHEAAHWTGHASRLEREFGKRFGDAAYAVEELVAELTAAFLCADLGVSNQPRMDHAEYVANWLQVLKSDSRAIFTAASAATKAADFLLASQAVEEKVDLAA